MPVNSRVHQMYSALVREGYGGGSAARIAQSKTGQSLKTGRPSKSRKKSLAATYTKRVV